MKAKNWVAGALLVSMLTGCATSRHSFYSDPMAVGDAQICRTLLGPEVQADPEFQSALRYELSMRGVSETQCGEIVQKQNVAIGVGAVLGAVIVAAAANSGGHGGHHSSETYIDIDLAVPIAAAAAAVNTSSGDYEWDWDQYQNTAGSLVWGCRGVQTRLLVDPARCNGREMNDVRWPVKTF